MANEHRARGNGYPRSALTALLSAERALFAAIAASHGYIVSAGPRAGHGDAVQFIQAINAGEIAAILLGDEERAHAITLLLAHEDETLRAIGEQLRSAIRREEQADQDEVQEYIEERRTALTS